MSRMMSELVKIKKELGTLKNSESDDIKKARGFLKEYKALRHALGKPIRILSPEQIKIDLTNQEFLTLIQEMERCQKSSHLK